jgi:hypothetical protein
MTKEEQIEKLELAEVIFIASMEGLPAYSESMPCFHAPHYRLIEGVVNGIERRVSFTYDTMKGKPVIYINSCFPRATQELTIIQFYEWMDKPHRIMMQDQGTF